MSRRCSCAACGHGREEDFNLQITLADPESTGNQSRRNKKEKIDAPGGQRVCTQNNAQPDDQQTSATDPQPGEKTKRRTNDQCCGERF